jgi:ABC-type multidrug transport system ATPase subunit
MAIMGPSGCGKTTLLVVLAQRKASAKAQVSSVVLFNGQIPSQSTFRWLSSYVESEDALIGSLTVKETLQFAAQLYLSGSVAATERMRRINQLLQAFGLANQANTLIGALLKKGISTGQKHRLSVASQLTSAPKVLFLEEPTSGFDSAASFKVMSYVREVTKTKNIIVMSSIHQPSTSTFELFDKLLLLSKGKVCFSGLVSGVKQYFDSIGHTMPVQTNPAEFVLDLINVDFDINEEACNTRIAQIRDSWASLPLGLAETTTIPDMTSGRDISTYSVGVSGKRLITTIWILLHHSWIKSRRDAIDTVYALSYILGLQS